MVRRSCLSTLTLASFAFALGSALSAHAATPARALISGKLDETQLLPLANNSRAEILNARNDRGAVADSLQLDHLQLVLQRPAEREADLSKMIDQMHTPGSAQFHKWVTPAEYGERFGLAQEDIAQVTEWLKMHGFTVNQVSPNGTVIDFSGTAGQLREAFHTEMHNLEVRGEKHIANSGLPQIPAALAPAVYGIASLSDFHPHPLLTKRSPITVNPDRQITTTNQALPGSNKPLKPDYTFTSNGAVYQAVVPKDLQTIYNINPLYNQSIAGRNENIVVLEDTNIYTADDWNTFRTVFGLTGFTHGNLQQTHPGNCTNPGVNSDDGEAILDAEWASAAAPGATITVASCANTSVSFGGLQALQNILNSGYTPPDVVSLSYGECESINSKAYNKAFRDTFQQAAAEGVSVFVSSGDSGANSCDAGSMAAATGINVSGFASTPYNVAVGGTDFGDTYAGTNADYWNTTNTQYYESAKSYINEIPWNDTCASTLIASLVTGSTVTYGPNGFCNSATGQKYFLNTVAGSGGPSTCAKGVPANFGESDGTCKGAPKPDWQKGVLGIPKDGVRDLPDVSLFAANGVFGHYYVFCYSDPVNGGAPCTGTPDTWSGGGGTSFSSPIMAGIQALVNQGNGGRQGNPNYVYYALAAKEFGAKGSSKCNSTLGNQADSSCTFYDVTQGDNDIPCVGTINCYDYAATSPTTQQYGVLSTDSNSYQPAYLTGVGYDLATGLGSVNAYNLVQNWSSALK